MDTHLEVLSPINIGTGEGITPFDYVIEDGFVNYDLRSLLDNKPELVKKIIHISRGDPNRYYLWKLLSEEDRKNRSYWNYRADMSNWVSGKLKSYAQDVQEYIKTPQFEPYIPGSSLKGALRTAVLYHIFSQSKKLFDSHRKKDFRNMEREIFSNGKKNPVYDLWKAISISDSNTTQPENALEVRLCRTLSCNGKSGRFKYWTYTEILRPGTELRCKISTNSDLLQSELVNKKTPWPDWLRKLDEKGLAVASQTFSADICKHEIEFFKKIKKPDCSELLKFYEILLHKIESADNNIGFVCLGQFIGWIKTTIGILLKKDKSVDFKQLRKRKRLATHRLNAQFPKTRRLIMSNPNQPLLPYGWLKISLSA